MKKLTTQKGVFGPYETVEMLTDRYRCDGADLPVTVVGVGEVTEWEGPLPQHTIPLTVEDFDRALEALLDATAQSRRYDNRITCALRAGYVGPFQAEGKAFASWMDTCNALAYQIQAEVLAGTRSVPNTVSEFLSEMPEMVWPTS